MYRHLLVPIDYSDLSTVTIGQAVEFARFSGARITFFHALEDGSGALTGEADLMRLTNPDQFQYQYSGRARELLTKAESAARAHGVACDSASVESSTPHVAIVEAARAHGCDLIFMASHGRRSAIGMMLGSQTLKVLTHAGMPVLVSAMSDPSAPALAIATIRDEHRSLAAVLHAFLHLLGTAREQGVTPDHVLMMAMLRYIQEFPVKLHHPKEQDVLFRILRERTSTMNAELDELERQHERDEKLVAELAALLERDAPAAEIEAAVSAYATFIWEHMGREEGVILPAAERYLSEANWQEVNTAFTSNADPRFVGNTEVEFRHLFSRIVNLAKS